MTVVADQARRQITAMSRVVHVAQLTGRSGVILSELESSPLKYATHVWLRSKDDGAIGFNWGHYDLSQSEGQRDLAERLRRGY